jgi:hypothetical protein
MPITFVRLSAKNAELRSRAVRKRPTPIPMRVDRRQAGIALLEDPPTPCA